MKAHEISAAEPARLCFFLVRRDSSQTERTLTETFEAGSGFELAGLICYGFAT